MGVKFVTLYHYIANLVNHPTLSKILWITYNLILDKNANKIPYLLVVLGEFNVKSSNRYKHNKTTYEGSKIDAITSQFGLQELIKETTHISTDSSSCIDLLFTSQPNLVMESRIHSSLYQNCPHQIIYAKINFKVFYPPP